MLDLVKRNQRKKGVRQLMCHNLHAGLDRSVGHLPGNEKQNKPGAEHNKLDVNEIKIVQRTDVSGYGNQHIQRQRPF